MSYFCGAGWLEGRAKLLGDDLFGDFFGSGGEGVDGGLGGVSDLFDSLFDSLLDGGLSLLALVSASSDREHHRDDCDSHKYFFHGYSTFKPVKQNTFCAAKVLRFQVITNSFFDFIV